MDIKQHSNHRKPHKTEKTVCFCHIKDIQELTPTIILFQYVLSSRE